MLNYKSMLNPILKMINTALLKLRTAFKFIIYLSLLVVINACQTDTTNKSSSKLGSRGSEQDNATKEQLKSFNTALQLLDNQKYIEAERLLLELTHSLPNLAGPWVNLALLNLIQKKPVEAETYLTKTLEISPDMPQALNLMGLLATHNRQIKSAENYFQLAIKNDNQYSNAHYNLALLYDIYLQDIAKAAFHYRQYLNLVDKDQDTQNWLNELESILKQ